MCQRKSRSAARRMGPEEPVDSILRLALPLLALLLVAGCASSGVTSRRTFVDEQLPRPGHIWVHDFAATADDVPGDSGLAVRAHHTAQTSEQIARGREAGAMIAGHLVERIRAVGLPAKRASARTTPRINDLVIRGYLVSMEEGSAAERVAIGMGSGTSELKAAVEGFQMTDRGLRRLGQGTVTSKGSESPGLVGSAAMAAATGNPAGLIVSSAMKVHDEESGSSTVEGRAKAVADEIADQLQPRFEAQGWIQ